MSDQHGRAATAWAFLHRHFLWLLVGAYALAAVAPDVGLWVGKLAAEGQVGQRAARLPAPAAMLAFLLFTAGLGVTGDRLRGVFRRPAALALGLAAGLVAPVAVVAVASPLLALWHDPAEAADLTVGMAVVAAMPVAASSAGWARAADGDCALSLGLVLLSTLLSPLTTPLAFQVAGAVAPAGAAGSIDLLAGAGRAGTFLTAWVAVPMALGVAVRLAAGCATAEQLGAWLKPLTSPVLLVLCYANASACLPGVAAEPDWDYLVLVLAAAGAMSGAMFAAGLAAARVARADPARRAALVFGVGTANNGAGLALASGALAACPAAVLLVVSVNLVQHLAAGVARRHLA